VVGVVARQARARARSGDGGPAAPARVAHLERAQQAAAAHGADAGAVDRGEAAAQELAQVEGGLGQAVLDQDLGRGF
jgi:hypothetical protein